MQQKVISTMQWLNALLENANIHYQIVGGFAATLHGCPREVADIDLYIADSDKHKLLPLIEPWISRPMAHYHEACWDLEYCQLIYNDQKIEIGISPGTKVRSEQGGEWHVLHVDFANSVLKPCGNLLIPVMAVDSLIAYKQVLNREVDIIDTEFLATLAS